ncbi:hypothetical protein [Methanothermobacter sp. K4]|nr:hypothetical protein [Methanothermobacter sp. K4]MCG2829251.1 hypothetical protein [Methanothermobacter sp. K4]
MKRLLCPLCRANVSSELYGSHRERFYHLICPSCGAWVCLDDGRIL